MIHLKQNPLKKEILLTKKEHTHQAKNKHTSPWRLRLLFLVFTLLSFLLIVRLVHLQVTHKAFLKAQGNARTIRIVDIPSYRGTITDRRGTPLAISTPVHAVWINPQHFAATATQQQALAQYLGLSSKALSHKITSSSQRSFVYLKRGLTPDVAEKIKALHIQGLGLKQEFRRYYPSGREMGQLIGFTDIDDQGQAGLELTYNHLLKPTVGKKRVLEDRTGQWVQDIEHLRPAQSGKDIALSIDSRIQGIAFRELEKAIKQYQAKSATLVMLDARTGEVLAMVSAPSFNPNNRQECHGSATRNRALTDQFEPGSTIKAFSIASALASKQFTPDTLIDTAPGILYLGHHKVRDIHPNGVLSLKEVLSKSSNIGITKMTLALPSERLVETFRALGLGDSIHTEFPGERRGTLPAPPKNAFAHATLAFGYGLAVTPLQIAHAYSILSSKGVSSPVSLLKIDDPNTLPHEQVLPSDVAQDTFMMLTEVLKKSTGGTGTRANIPGYKTAGKTGTTRVVGPHGYDPNRHIALFVGITPVDDPRLVTLIVVEEPDEKHYFGGLVAAPIYKNVVSKALYMLNIPPDNAAS